MTLALDPQRPQTERKSGEHFLTYLRHWAEFIQLEQRKLRKLTEMSVTLRRRDRGLTISDMVSHYGTRKETNGIWIEYEPELDGEVHPINIIQPTFRANTNACLQSNASIRIESADASAKNKKIAERWQKVNDYFERTSWNEEERTILFDAAQKDGTVLIKTYFEKADPIEVPDVQEKSQSIAEYFCQPCGSSGRQEIESPTNEQGEVVEGEMPMPCPKCGQQAIGSIKTLQSFDINQTQVQETIPKHEIIPFFNFCIDAYNAKYKGVQSAKWLQIEKLRDRSYVETKYHQHSFGSPTWFSYQIQSDWAIANSEWDRLNGYWVGRVGSPQFDVFAEKVIYLHEEAYSNYVSPDDFEWVNGNGELVFKISAGQTIAEALEAIYGENPKGFAFVWMNDELIDIVSPNEEETNLRHAFKSVHWLRDSGSFYSSPNYSLVIIQDDITLLNTMNHNIIAQNAVVPVFYDSLVFEASDFSKQFIGTKNNALLGEKGIGNHVTSLPIPTPSPYLSNQLQFLWQVKDSVSLVTPAQRGEQQKGETYAAQRQQLEQSYGNLTAILKSFAQAKIEVFKQKARICKNKWTLEEFQKVSAMFGEIWTDEDVREMTAIDFERDLLIDYLEGSEIPSSNTTREIAFYNGLQQIISLLGAGFPIEPDKAQKILSKIDEFGNFDFDVTGLEVDELISQKRVIQLQNVILQYGKVSLQQIEQLKANILGIDEMSGEPFTEMDMLMKEIFMNTDIRFSKYENLEQQGKAFNEALKIEIGKDNPNYLLVEAFTVMLGMLEKAIQMAVEEAMMNSPEAMMQKQQLEAQNKMAEEEKANADTEKESAKEEKDEEFKRQLALKSADHESEKEKMILEAELNKQNQSQPEK